MATFASFANANSVCASRGAGGCITNTAFGYGALANNSTGYSNTAIGRAALAGNTSGNRNTAIGAFALSGNTTGVCNTAIGVLAGYLIGGGNNLTAVGYMAARNTTGDSNTMVGAFAGCNVTTGVSNVLFGAFAGCGMQGGSCNVGIGARALKQATSNLNVAIGYEAGDSITSGGCHVMVGMFAGRASTQTCTISIGYESEPSSTNGHTVWGNNTTNYNGVAAGWTNVSDCRDKTNIQDLDEKLGLDFIRSLEPVSFNLDTRGGYVKRCGYEYGTKDGSLASPKKSYGFLAQQMKELLTSLNTEFDAIGYDGEQDAYRLTYSDMISPLVKAVQQTVQRLETLEALAE
jgi:hypothetical protein